MKQLIILSFVFLTTHYLKAQTGIIKGSIVNAINNETIPFANILITGTETGTQTDFDGNYKIENLQAGLYNLQVSCVGFKSKTVFEIQVTNAIPAIIYIQLEENISELETVTIVSAPNDKTEESPLSLRTIGVNEIKRNPGGNRDISVVIQSLPGVSTTASFRNDILIRGGAPNENRFYLDGIEVPNINHFATQGSSGGPVGLINVDFINEVKFYSGAFPANRGNTLSSVFEFNQKDGRTDKWGAAFTIGSSDLGITTEGPTGKNSSFLFSARRSYLQFLFDALGLPFLPTYNDFQLKEKIKFNSKNELTIIGLGAIDDFALNTEDDTSDFQQYILGSLPVSTQWNYTVGVSYKRFHSNGSSLFVASRNMLNNRAYKYLNNDESSEMNLIYDYTSREAENKFRFEENVRIGTWKLNGGVNYEYAKYTNKTYQIIPTEIIFDTLDFNSLVDLHKWGFFVQASKSFFDEIFITSIGLRADANNYSAVMNNLFRQFSPRFSFSYQFYPRWSFNVNTGIYYQLPAYTILGYKNADGVLENKINEVTYIQSKHAVAGFEFRPNNYLRFSLEGFYKQYANYPFLIRDSISLANLGADFGVIGNAPVSSSSEGKSYGIEFLAQQKLSNNIFGILAYTFVKSEFTDKNGNYIASSWDNRHILSFTAGKKFKKDWETGAKFRYASGLPYTPTDVAFSSLIDVWEINRAGTLNYDSLNTLRLDANYQLDIRIDKKWFLKRMNINLYIDVQNVFNSKVDQPAIFNVLRDGDGNNMINAEDPTRYDYYFIDNTNGTVLPSVGLILEI
ncbi:MAG: TonB-dependent receptor [Fimbriimonadaceae bacterium]|nr:TonB-dependent receptor [Chitinophagales bacterium]